MGTDLTSAGIALDTVQQPPPVQDDFYVIGVGASAGGLDAIRQLLSRLDQGFRHSLVIIQHISPDYKSMMSEILRRETTLPVQEVTDDMVVEDATIYLIPPHANIIIQRTDPDRAKEAPESFKFSLVNPTPRPGLNLPIDVFFHSLAETMKSRAIAVILSGSGSDGSRGLLAIKDREGFVLVHEPEMASFDGMPRSAIATGVVDITTAPDQIIAEIDRYLQVRQSGINNVEQLFNSAGNTFAELLEHVSRQTDIDFNLYKEPVLKRRVARRLALRKFTNLEDYLGYLKREPSELNSLYREFLVGVTNFFRDLPVWYNLQSRILPALFQDGSTDEPVRVWSVGCSTGEEAYTIAMLLEQYREANGIEREFRVFATDVNEHSIETAKQGDYPESIRDEIPQEFWDHGYVKHQAGTCTITPLIRNRVVFSIHNVLEDPPFTRTDLIVCRNLLIYFGPDQQSKALTHFSFSLRKGGFLQLGAAETPGRQGTMFETVVHKHRVYRNSRDPSQQRGVRSMEFQVAQFLPRSRAAAAKGGAASQDLEHLLQFALDADTSCICVVDSAGKVIKTFGDHTGLLEFPESDFSAHILDLLEDGLRSPVGLVLRQAELAGEAKKAVVRLLDDQTSQALNIKCQKVSWDNQLQAFAIAFHRRPEKFSARAVVAANEVSTQHTIEHLEAEVKSLQDILSVTVEDLRTSNEALQTTNEELIASNEELQASNEETQSINEELHTLNAESSSRINELEAATSDTNNLLATADLGVLVLDDRLCIRQFSAGLSQYVTLEDSDIGRPLANFALGLDYGSQTKLMDDIRLSCEQGRESTRELRGKDSSHAFCRVRPYRDVHCVQTGVVITLQDITQVKLLAQEVREQRDRLESLLESEAAGYWDWQITDGTIFMSPRFKKMLGYEIDEIEDTPAGRDALIFNEDLPKVRAAFERHVESRGVEPYDLEMRCSHKDGSIIWVLSRGRVVEWSPDNQPVSMMGVNVDITPMKNREEAIQQRAVDIRRFAFVAAHDLVQPMKTIESCIEMLEEDFPEDLGDDWQQMLGFLTTAIQRMKGRIGGILDFSRLQDEEFELVPVDTGAVVRDCLDDLGTTIDDTNAEVYVRDVPMVMGSDSMVLRVIQNIISNALKYRRKGGPCCIWIETADAPDDMAAFRIVDNGIGIAPEDRKKIFELFTRLHTAAEYTGNGLGLALAERIVSQLNGQISVSDGIDGGTAFTVTLQAAKEG